MYLLHMAWTIRIERDNTLKLLLKRIDEMALDMNRMANDVQSNSDAIDSAITLLDQLAEEIRANAGDAAAMNDLADKLEANSGRLGEAVAANTPAAP